MLDRSCMAYFLQLEVHVAASRSVLPVLPNFRNIGVAGISTEQRQTAVYSGIVLEGVLA